MSEWEVAYDDGATFEVYNRGGRWWHELPNPPRFFHRHRAQTRGAKYTDCFWTERCACGATHFSDIPGWTKRER